MKLGVSLLLFFLVLAIASPLLERMTYSEPNLASKLQTPTAGHWLGTDDTGSDILSLMIQGTRVTLKVSLAAVGICLLIGLITGALAGYYEGLVESIFMRITDMLYAFPGFLLALAVVGFLGPGTNHLIVALCITGWTSYARLIRGEILALKQKEFITAAIATGASDRRIILVHLLPNLVGVLGVQVCFGFAAVILTEAGLSFLGLGSSPREASWGTLLSTGRKYLFEAPHVSLFPGLAILMLVLSFNLIGEGLRARFDLKESQLT